jgi:hypothetical protein
MLHWRCPICAHNLWAPTPWMPWLHCFVCGLDFQRKNLEAKEEEDQTMFVIFRVTCGQKTLRLRRGNFSNRLIIPSVRLRPFRCWLLSWRWGQVGWELSRWS